MMIIQVSCPVMCDTDSKGEQTGGAQKATSTVMAVI